LIGYLGERTSEVERFGRREFKPNRPGQAKKFLQILSRKFVLPKLPPARVGARGSFPSAANPYIGHAGAAEIVNEMIGSVRSIIAIAREKAAH
jgi:hypothetical protein